MIKRLFSFNIGAYTLSLDKKENTAKGVPNEPTMIYSKEHDERLLINPKEEYEKFIVFVHQWLQDRNEETERLQLINFLLNLIKKDIQVDLLSEVYYKNEFEITDLTRECFIPLGYIDENGIAHSLEPFEEKDVDLSKVVTVVIPWKRTRMRDAIINVAKYGFRFDKNNHNSSLYFKEIDLCYAKSGNHHISSGIIQNTGYLEARVYTIEQLFPHVKTDGEYWLNIHTGEKLNLNNEEVKVFDFRVAVLYELAKIKYQLLKKTN